MPVFEKPCDDTKPHEPHEWEVEGEPERMVCPGRESDGSPQDGSYEVTDPQVDVVPSED